VVREILEAVYFRRATSRTKAGNILTAATRRRKYLHLVASKIAGHESVHPCSIGPSNTVPFPNLELTKKMTGVDVLDRVFAGIAAAKQSGLDPIKINAVIVRGHNEDEVADFAAFAREHDVKMRFIEFMPLDSGHEWSRDDVVSGREIRERISEQFPLTPIDIERGSETSARYRFADGAPGEIGIIAPVTEPFCGACSRIRLTADGQIRTCLFSTVEHSLRDVVRSGATRAGIVEFIESVVLKKEPRHYINDPSFIAPSRSMSFIGG
jgi:cyclic pyranopterin phosphate synthase